ncbi:YceI family protein [Hyphomonas pacifica]|uniref:Lipid/polyisoprenoid-binding YceI-like domain-containing protein n=1 Tax=Hyphomonas pacifica TaxID=1280941 RepID=A0A062U3V4_9PROT|nr:YceI family protein [Hyphomonas pacifica]KCZ52428.1 hypothetical protein HY2_08420 [Hyphomonas pacifica]RAN35201.1 hypothetical protein HY3_09020 [Hyphomonas pacifica]RAN37326.1 hypothetical protein HY11_09530 [Hyphomonas pacifica]
MTARSLALLGIATASLWTLAACASVVTPFLKPDVETQSIQMKGGNWQLDPAHASLLFKINHLDFSTYVGRFDHFDVTLKGDPRRPEEAMLEAIVDMMSLDIANDEFAQTLMGSDWFDAAHYPQARFQSTRIILTSETTADVEGVLTLHGRSAPITLSVKFNGSAHDRLRGADVAGFSIRGDLDRTEFGISKFSGLLADTVHLEIEAELLRKPDVS